MKRLTLQQRMFGGLTLMMSLSLLVFGFLLVQLNTIEGRAEGMRKSAVDASHITAVAENFNLLAIDALMLMVTNPDQATVITTVDKIDANFVAMNSGLAELEKDPHALIQVELKKVRENMDQLNPVWDTSEQFYREGKTVEGSATLLANGQKYGTPIIESMTKLKTISNKFGAESYREVTDAHSTTQTLGLVAMGLAVLGTIALMWFIVRSVSGSVGRSASAVTGSAADMGVVSARMSENAQETAVQADVVSAAAGQVSVSVQTVASAVEEMTASVREIAQNASEASRVAEQAVEVAEETNATVSKLGVSSAEIGEVIAVITSIAEQTNLLAL
ncbi:MAG: MCP four helix bundle domain-containing protein, partial [Acidimicrobiales bacterium]